MNQIVKSVQSNLPEVKYANNFDVSSKKISIVLKKYFIETKGFNQKNLDNKAFSIRKNENNIQFFEKLKNHINKENLNCFLVKNKTENGYKWIKTRFYLQSDNEIKMEFLNEINDVSKKNKIEILFHTIQKIEANLNPIQQSKYIEGYLEYHNSFSFDEFIRNNF